MVVAVLWGALAACGGDTPDGAARTTVSDTPVSTSPPVATTEATPEVTVAVPVITSPAATTTAASSAEEDVAPSSEGLGESISISESVTIIVSDPED